MQWNEYFTNGTSIEMPSMLASTPHIGALIECATVLQMLSKRDDVDIELMRYWNKKAELIINDISNGLTE
jgi:hypothetical protein